MNKYKLGSNIIIISGVARYIKHSQSDSLCYCDMISENVDKLTIQTRQKKKITKYITINPLKKELCTNTDECGLCIGHKMSRKEFIKLFCNGVEPPDFVDSLYQGKKRHGI